MDGSLNEYTRESDVASSLIGQTLGKYKVLEQLGQGGMATVYLGYQESVDRQVAIKVLPPHPGLDEGFAERFQIEARTIARLQHPHILPLYDYGQQDDILYLVMAYADSGTLEDRLEQDPISTRRVGKYLREIAGAMDYAHRQGVIHRDIKPANILLSSEDHALLADFGIVKLTEGGANLTGTGVVGTPSYMAPEQAQGHTVDGRADIYSLGVVIYQLLTGETPFMADTVMQIMLKVMQEPAPNILDVVPDLPPDLGAVMDKVLAKDPDQRYQTASEFAEDFNIAIANGTTQARVNPVTTQKFPPSELATEAALPPDPGAQTMATDSGSQTVIVHQHSNPWILIGGFAIVAVAMITVVFLLITGLDNEPSDQVTPAANATEIRTAVAVNVPTFGRLSYGSTEDGFGDTLNIRVDDLRLPGSGKTYSAWLVNTSDNATLHIGEITVDSIGFGVLSYTDSEGRMLPAEYDGIVISVEENGSVGEEPAGEIAYSGRVPNALMNVLTEIYIASENGLNGGSLLDGAKTEAKTAAQHAGLAARASDPGGMHTHAEHTINILRGEEEDYNGNGRGENPGRGIGVFNFITWIDEALSNAVTAEGSTNSIQSNAEFIRVCLDNTRIRAERLVELESELLASDSLEAVTDQQAEATAIAQQLQAGFDLNEDGEIEPFEGECGLDQIEAFGVLVGSLDITEGPPEA